MSNKNTSVATVDAPKPTALVPASSSATKRAMKVQEAMERMASTPFANKEALLKEGGRFTILETGTLWSPPYMRPDAPDEERFCYLVQLHQAHTIEIDDERRTLPAGSDVVIAWGTSKFRRRSFDEITRIIAEEGPIGPCHLDQVAVRAKGASPAYRIVIGH